MVRPAWSTVAPVEDSHHLVRSQQACVTGHRAHLVPRGDVPQRRGARGVGGWLHMAPDHRLGTISTRLTTAACSHQNPLWRAPAHAALRATSRPSRLPRSRLVVTVCLVIVAGSSADSLGRSAPAVAVVRPETPAGEGFSPDPVRGLRSINGLSRS